MLNKHLLRLTPGARCVSHQLKHNMKKLRNAFLIGLAALVVSQAWTEESEGAKNDLVRLRGEWLMVSGSADGQPMPEEIRKQMKRVCKGDEATTTMGERIILKAKITLDPLQKPKTINYQMTDGVTKGKTQLGIYELDGDTFKSCFSAPGDPRPTDFTTKPGDRRTLTQWKREKAATLSEQK